MTEQEMWQAVQRSDAGYDGLFFYAVKTTGIFCRPSCRSKPPKRENLCYFASGDEARAAGFRPCKRCRSDLLEYQPMRKIAAEIKTRLDQAASLDDVGLTPRRMTDIFKQEYGVTPKEYADVRRLRAAKEMLAASPEKVIDVAYQAGFSSLAAFNRFFQAADRANADSVSKGASSAMKGTAIYPSPVGDMQLDWEDGAVTALKNADKSAKAGAPNELTRLVFRQLDEYFAGTRKTFDFPYRLHGTPFQEKVWAALRQIPYGETRSYKDIAEAIGHPKAFRAVGMANHANPIFIAIPCHRVIGASGSLVGYGGGLEMKRALLALEAGSAR